MKSKQLADELERVTILAKEMVQEFEASQF